MELWLDAQISPVLAPWVRTEFSMECFALRDFQLRDADDAVIFKAAKQKQNVIIITKDQDFADLLNRLNA